MNVAITQIVCANKQVRSLVAIGVVERTRSVGLAGRRGHKVSAGSKHRVSPKVYAKRYRNRRLPIVRTSLRQLIEFE